MEDDGLLTTPEAAKRLGVARTLLYYWHRQGKLPMFWAPYHSRRLVRIEDLEALRPLLRRNANPQGLKPESKSIA